MPSVIADGVMAKQLSDRQAAECIRQLAMLAESKEVAELVCETSINGYSSRSLRLQVPSVNPPPEAEK